MKFLKELFVLFVGAIPTIILPTLMFGFITNWIEVNFTFKSIQFYCWVGLLLWLGINYMLISIKGYLKNIFK